MTIEQQYLLEDERNWLANHDIGGDAEAWIIVNALSRLVALRKELGQQIEFDRTAVADGVTAIKKAVNERHWLTEGRGPYEWNDDNWHKEFAAAAVEILNAAEPLAKIAANWKDSPMLAEEIVAARIDLRQRAEASLRESQERERWIPVSEQAPPEKEEIVVRLPTLAKVVAHWMPGGYCIEDHPAIDAGWHYWTGYQFTPLASEVLQKSSWRPLPIPPQAGETR